MFKDESFSTLCNWLDWAFDNHMWDFAQLVRIEITSRLSKAEFGEMS